MQVKEPFRLVEFTNPSGAIAYRVTGFKADRTRVRENFKTESEARARKQELEIEIDNTEPAAPLRRTVLTPEQITQAERAFADLGDKPLPDAIRFYLDNYNEPFKPIKVSAAFAVFIAEKEKANKREDTIRNLKSRVCFVTDKHGEKLVSDIQEEDLREAIYRPNSDPITIRNNRLAIGNFFRWCVRKKHCRTNPMANIESPTVDQGEPEILTVPEVRRLLNAAQEHKDGKLVPYVVLSVFCGIRPTELKRIGKSWDNIDLKARTVTLDAKTVKARMRGRRIVEISKNAVEWLRPHSTKHTPIRTINWRKDFDAVKEAAGFGSPTKEEIEKKLTPKLKPWPQDVMRHTAISNHLAEHKHEGKTADWAGNSPDVIHSDYKGLVKPKEAKEFWSIKPDARKIISLKAA
jgi:integrase